MLTEQELNRVFSWLPYRDCWTVDRNLRNDNIDTFYGDLIKKLTHNILFDTYYSENGGLGNYLEFICYPKGLGTYRGSAVLVCISLCAPIAGYGQTTFSKGVGVISWGGMFRADSVGDIADKALASIESEIKLILLQQKLLILDKEFASRELPVEVAQALKNENHNGSSQYLHGIFQKID